MSTAPKAPKPSLLDQLRAKAEVVRAQDAEARQPMEKAREEIDSCLWRAFRWLEEAVQHLAVIRPTVAREFRLSNILTVDHPRLESGFVAFRRSGLSMQDELETVQAYYRLTATERVVLRAHPSAVKGIDDRLRATGMPFQYHTEQDAEERIRCGVFHVEPTISASVLFEADYKRGMIDVTLANVDRFETLRLEFRPAMLDTSALEDLVQHMLGETNAFLHRAPLALIKARRDDEREAGPQPDSGTSKRPR